MKIYKKSRIFAIILIECYSPIPTWIGSYIVWVNVCGGGGVEVVCVWGGGLFGGRPHTIPHVYRYFIVTCPVGVFSVYWGCGKRVGREWEWLGFKCGKRWAYGGNK